MKNKNLEEFRKDLINKPKEETNKEFQDFKESAMSIKLNDATKRLNVDRIKDLNDIKRILNFLDIKVVANGVMKPNGYDEVRDLFEY